MTAPAWRSTATSSKHYAFDADQHHAPGEFFPGERIGPPRAGSGGKALLRGGLVILVALGGGWALLGDQANWPGWLSAQFAAVYSSMDRSVAAPVRPATPVAIPGASATVEPTTQPGPLDPPPSTLHSPASSETAVHPGAAAKSGASPLTSAAISPAATGLEPPPATPLRPPTADHADRYQSLAAAAGLHPDLSRVLLERLSPTDYRNAGIAVQTALAETPDAAVFVWPRQRKPELALFTIRFVSGAAPDCRRYVVTVTKDGWLTTALPMEKCGAQTGRLRRQ